MEETKRGRGRPRRTGEKPQNVGISFTPSEIEALRRTATETKISANAIVRAGTAKQIALVRAEKGLAPIAIDGAT